MKPFIPNDKFNIVGLEACWKCALDSLGRVDEAYFCELASKTFLLFYQYRQSDTVPKELLRLLPIMSCYAAEEKYAPYSVEDITRAITKELVTQLIEGFKKIKNLKTGRLEACEKWMAIPYMHEHYQVNTLSFDFSPIKEKRSIRL